MTLLHVLAGLVLAGSSGTLIVRGFTPSPPESDRGTTVLPAFVLAVAWAVVLFTGFLQLGSQNALPRLILYKIGATAGGGVVSLLAVYGFVRGAIPVVLFAAAQALACAGFVLTFYWGLLLSFA